MTKSIAAQSIGGRPGIARKQIASRFAQVNAQEPFSFPTASSAYTFTPPVAGYWKFVAWGCGGDGTSGTSAGSSGAYIEVTRFLTPATPVTIAVNGSNATVITFADGSVVTAGGGAQAVAGVATGGDVNLNGTSGVLTGSLAGNPGQGTGGGAGAPAASGSGGAGAPGNLPYRGGQGGSTARTATVGGGAGEGASSVRGQGLALAVFLHP